MKKQYPYDASQGYLVSSSNQLESFHEVSSTNDLDWSATQYIISIILINLSGGFLVGLFYSLFLGFNVGMSLGLIHGIISGSLWSFICFLRWNK